MLEKSTKRDWGSFEGKLRAGKLVEQAAEEAGIPLGEAAAWLASNRKNAPDDDALRVLAAEAIHHGITTLIELSKIRDGRKKSLSESDTSPQGGVTRSVTLDYPDEGAAKALVSAGLAIRKMIRPRPEVEASGAKDLFDRLPASNWTFAKRD